MAYKQENYTILASYQHFDNDGHMRVYVAIESSPEKFKAYVGKDIFYKVDPFKAIMMEVAKYGDKLGGIHAREIFPLIALSHTYEG